MEKITREGFAARALAMWEDQYKNNEFVFSDGRKAGDILEELKALGPKPSPDDVDRVIGNPSWTSVPRCSECGKEDAPFVVQVGEPDDYDSATAWLCPECISGLAKLAGGGVMEWKPIESAPKDGSRFLAWCDDTVIIVAWEVCEFDDEEVRFCDEHGFGVNPTHWMPLPEPPPND